MNNSEREKQKRIAYDDGWNAYCNGVKLDDNPYGTDDDELREEWGWGWMDAGHSEE